MWPLHWIIILYFVSKSQAVPTEYSRISCSVCKPGYYVQTSCNSDKDTVCAPCPPGTFSHQFSLDNKCNPCSKCGNSLFELKQCTSIADVFCESCASRNHKHLKTYLEFCLGYDPDVANIQADETVVTKDALENGAKTEIIENNVKTEIIENGVKTEIVQNDVKTEINSDSKKEDKLIETSKQPLDKKDETVVDILPLDNLAELPRKEVEEEGLLPVVSMKTPIETDETSLYEYKGISISDSFEGSGGSFDGSGADILTQTTPLIEELPSSGEGEIIIKDNGEKNDNVDTRVVLGTNKFRTFPPDEDGEEEVVVDAKESKELEKLHTTAVDNRKRAAIIVGVALGSVAFFTVGFFISRYYRKKRTFRISQKIPTNSKNHHVNGSKEAIEFQDMSKSSKIYKEPDMSSKNGSYKRMDAYGADVSPEDLYTISLKKESRLKNSSEDKHVNGIDRMKYMDEVDAEDDDGTDGATEKLLPKDQGDQGDDLNDNQSTSLTDVLLDKLDQRLSPIEEEEKTPMLPK